MGNAEVGKSGFLRTARADFTCLCGVLLFVCMCACFNPNLITMQRLHLPLFGLYSSKILLPGFASQPGYIIHVNPPVYSRTRTTKHSRSPQQYLSVSLYCLI